MLPRKGVHSWERNNVKRFCGACRPMMTKWLSSCSECGVCLFLLVINASRFPLISHTSLPCSFSEIPVTRYSFQLDSTIVISVSVIKVQQILHSWFNKVHLFVWFIHLPVCLSIVKRGEWLWNPTKFFVVYFCSLFRPWLCTKRNSCVFCTEELTNYRNMLAIHA